MISRTTVRHLVHAELTARLDAKLTAVTVQDGALPRDQTKETVIVGENCRTVETSMPYMQGGRKQRVDRFAFEVEFYATQHGQTTPAVAKARVAEMFTALDDTLADDPTLGDLILSALINNIAGPTSEGIAPDGFGGYMTATVECLSQLN